MRIQTDESISFEEWVRLVSMSTNRLMAETLAETPGLNLHSRQVLVMPTVEAG